MKNNHFFDRDIVTIKDFSKADLEFVFDATDKVSSLKPKERGQLASARTLGYIFYEPSTRTRMSFEAAMASIGGSSFGIFDPRYSSIEKGETLYDTIRTMDLYSDILVLRHQMDGSSRYAAEISTHPVLNGGSGSEEHPTQAMLDLYTMKKEKKNIDGLKICILGDLKYGRTVYSLLYGLVHYNVEIYLVSPPSLRIRQESIYGLTEKLKISELTELDDELLSKIDVLYVTRIQRERFPDIQEYEKVKGTYIIDSNVLNRLKSDASIMHPMPRIDEISKNIDLTKNAIYFKQVAYGKELRAALLALVLNESGL
jgi:aspartate carbamoyltransferase catalytic subunit